MTPEAPGTADPIEEPVEEPTPAPTEAPPPDLEGDNPNFERLSTIPADATFKAYADPEAVGWAGWYENRDGQAIAYRGRDGAVYGPVVDEPKASTPEPPAPSAAPSAPRREVPPTPGVSVKAETQAATLARLAQFVRKAAAMSELPDEDPSLEGENPFASVGPSPALGRVEYRPVIDREEAEQLALAIEKASKESNWALAGQLATHVKGFLDTIKRVALPLV